MPFANPYLAALAERADRDHANRRAQHALFKLQGRLRRTRTAFMDAAELGLTCAQLRVLEVLIEHPNCNISEIARRLDLTRQAVHRVVHLLADCGFVWLERTRRGDQRAVIPRLSEIAHFCATNAITWQRDFLRTVTGEYRLQNLQFIAAALDRIWGHVRRNSVATEPEYEPL